MFSVVTQWAVGGATGGGPVDPGVGTAHWCCHVKAAWSHSHQKRNHHEIPRGAANVHGWIQNDVERYCSIASHEEAKGQCAQPNVIHLYTRSPCPNREGIDRGTVSLRFQRAPLDGLWA